MTVGDLQNKFLPIRNLGSLLWWISKFLDYVRRVIGGPVLVGMAIDADSCEFEAVGMLAEDAAFFAGPKSKGGAGEYSGDGFEFFRGPVVIARTIHAAKSDVDGDLFAHAAFLRGINRSRRRRRAGTALRIGVMAAFAMVDSAETSRAVAPFAGRVGSGELTLARPCDRWGNLGCATIARPANGSGDSPRPPFLSEFVNHIGKLLSDRSSRRLP